MTGTRKQVFDADTGIRTVIYEQYINRKFSLDDKIEMIHDFIAQDPKNINISLMLNAAKDEIDNILNELLDQNEELVDSLQLCERQKTERINNYNKCLEKSIKNFPKDIPIITSFIRASRSCMQTT